MKKYLILAVCALFLGGGVFANTLEDWQKERLEEKDIWLDELVEEGRITQEQADERITFMIERMTSEDCTGEFLGRDKKEHQGFMNQGAGNGFRNGGNYQGGKGFRFSNSAE